MTWQKLWKNLKVWVTRWQILGRMSTVNKVPCERWWDALGVITVGSLDTLLMSAGQMQAVRWQHNKGPLSEPRHPYQGGANWWSVQRNVNNPSHTDSKNLNAPLSRWGKEGGPVKYDARQNRAKRLSKSGWRYVHDYIFVQKRVPSSSPLVEQSSIHEKLNRKQQLEEDSHIYKMCQRKYVKTLLESGAAWSIISKHLLDTLPGKHKLRTTYLKHFVAAHKNHMKVLGVATLTIHLGEDHFR